MDLQIVGVLTSEPDQVNWYLMEAAYIALVLCGLFILTLVFICYKFATESIASESELLTLSHLHLPRHSIRKLLWFCTKSI